MDNIVSHCLLSSPNEQHRLLSSPIVSSAVELLIILITSCIVTCSSPDRSSCCVAVFEDGFRHKLSPSKIRALSRITFAICLLPFCRQLSLFIAFRKFLKYL